MERLKIDVLQTQTDKGGCEKYSTIIPRIIRTKETCLLLINNQDAYHIISRLDAWQREKMNIYPQYAEAIHHYFSNLIQLFALL
jgi:hypothetical protein